MDFEVRIVFCVHRNRGSRQHLIMSVQYGFISPYSCTLAQISRDRQSYSSRTIRIPYRSVQSFLGTEIKAGYCVVFLETLA